ncbi:hypothetical protein LINPERPRIM_LOCUS27049 [Linum perenne]
MGVGRSAKLMLLGCILFTLFLISTVYLSQTSTRARLEHGRLLLVDLPKPDGNEKVVIEEVVVVNDKKKEEEEELERMAETVFFDTVIEPVEIRSRRHISPGAPHGRSWTDLFRTD